MILETEQEKKAWEFVSSLALSATDRICNDLNQEEVKKFEGLTTDCDDNGIIIEIPIVSDYQVIGWLGGQIK